ncbi:MAG: hypothetical protein R3A44_11155 [Caldilineaceae bacterium]
MSSKSKPSTQRYWIIGALATLFMLFVMYQGVNAYYQQVENARQIAQIQQIIEAAQTALQEGDKNRASVLYQQIIAEGIDDISLLNEVDKLELQLIQIADPQATSLPIEHNLAQLLTEANLAYAANDWPQTIELYEQLRAADISYEAAKVEPQLLDAYVNQSLHLLALGRQQGGDLGIAATYFQKALRLLPTEPTALAESPYLNDYLSAERALREGSPEEALALLTPLYEQPRQFLRADVTNLLFRTYLILGDWAVRSNQISKGEEYYQKANQITDVDKENLQRRLDSIGLLFAPTPTAVAAAANPVAVAPAQPAAPAEQPAAPPTATPLPTPVPTSAPVCADARSVLREPYDNAILSGVVTFTGTATHEALQLYKLDYAPWGTSVYAYFTGGEQPVENGVLGTLDTRALPNGHYSMRLVVVDRDGNYPPPCEVHVIVAN